MQASGGSGGVVASGSGLAVLVVVVVFGLDDGSFSSPSDASIDEV